MKEIISYLGIDCGGTTLKAALFDEAFNELAFSRVTLNLISQKPGFAERDLHDLSNKCVELIKKVLQKSEINPAFIKGLAITAQGKGLFAVDKNGNPVENGILSADRRAIEVVRKWQQEGIPQKIYPKTRQTLWTGHPVSILRYLKDNDRARFDAISDIFMAHDYLRYFLTGQRACEVTNISESNLYNMQTNAFDAQLAQTLGIEECIDKLPKIAGSTEVCGLITKEAAALTGLKEGTPVFGGLFDVVSMAISVGLHDDTAMNCAMGTWAVATCFTDHIADDDKPYVYGRHVKDHNYIVHEASPTSSGNLEWVCNTLGVHDFNEINALVRSVPKASNDVYFIPFLYGTNASLDATAGFYGLQSIHTKADLFTASFEGVVFSHLKHIRSIGQKFTNAKKLIVTGGSTHSKEWMQIMADASGLPVVLSDIEETGCFGAAIVAMVGSGLYPDLKSAFLNMPKATRVIEPDPKAKDVYEEKFARFNLLVASLGAFHEKAGKRKF